VEIGLVDRIGTLEDAATAAALMADLPIPPHVVEKKESRFSLRDLIRESRLFLRALPSPLPRIEYRLF
jgi:ClpP class serine protease